MRWTETQSLCDGPITRPEKSYRVCVSKIVIKSNNNHQHLHKINRIKKRWATEVKFFRDVHL